MATTTMEKVTQMLGGPSARTIVIVGFTSCGYFSTAASTAQTIAARNPTWAAFEIVGFPSRAEFKSWLALPNVPGRPVTAAAQSHTSSPFVYLKNGPFIGGNDRFQEFVKEQRSQM